MKFNLKRAVDMLAKKDLKFLQPLYEAITNSLESGSDKIIVELFREDTISDEITPHITGFSVTDNGEGFTKKNRESFLELWSDKKTDLGCRGSGRFTWLSVFRKITINSEVASENKQVFIPFSLDFNDSNIAEKDQEYKHNKTTIMFEDVTDKYYDINSKLDNRALADIDKITFSIEQNLLLKLFLLKNKGVKYSIKVILNTQEKEINENTIPTLESKPFGIVSDVTKEEFGFKLYYHFIDNNKNSKKIYYCANARTVKEEDDDALNFSCELPNKVSFNMLLCSSYLDDMVNDSRDDFPGMSNKRQANYGCPLLFKDIKPELLRQMHLILLEKFPELESLNKEQEQKAIDASPYLTKYIRENTDIVKTEKSLTTKALDTFNKQKQTIKKRFEKLLNDKSIDETAFQNAVAELSEVATAELGEYILYRDSIIKALNEAALDADKKEGFIHDIFMPRRTKTSSNDEAKHLLSNLWLLDDKFMTYSYTASDEEYNAIITDIEKENEKRGISMGNKRPDLFILYNKQLSKDVVIVEFKKPCATLNEKENAPIEIGRNIGIARKNIQDANSIYGYIITTLDNDFIESLEYNGYISLFTKNEDSKILYTYIKHTNAHIFVLDLKAITEDAFARNKTFLDILKKQV